MAKSMAPLLLLGGGLAVLMLTKKKDEDEAKDLDEFEMPPHVPDDDEEELTEEEKCDRFLTELYVENPETGALPIEEVAVEQEIIPYMRKSAQEILESEGTLNPNYHALSNVFWISNTLTRYTWKDDRFY